MSQEKSKLFQAAVELGEVLAQDEEFLEMVYHPTINLEEKLEQAKLQLFTDKGNVKTNPRTVVELLEKVMILQSLNGQSTYSTSQTAQHFQGKIDKLKWDDTTPPNIALYLFWQVISAIAYSSITIVLITIAYIPAAMYCDNRQSPFCTGIQNMKTYFVGEVPKQPGRIVTANLK